mmetsp:Transcript_126226/g.282008  ORF Transcript_126226/g.282008 Transcript_126226/m.282008 type:complete len:457 (-) Transcript_126226:154-1524(-)
MGVFKLLSRSSRKPQASGDGLRRRRVQGAANRARTGTWSREVGCRDVEMSGPAPKMLYPEAAHGMMAEDSARESNENLISSTSKSGEQSANEKKLNEIQAAMEAYEDQKVREGVEDVEEAMKEYAKKQITEATSNTDLIMKAEILIQEDWLGKTDELPGNIYCLMAFGDVMASGSACLSTEGMLAVAKLLGWVLIVLIQFFGPVLMFFSCTMGTDMKEDKMWHWRCAQWSSYVPLFFHEGDHYNPEDERPCMHVAPGADMGMQPKEVSIFLDWQYAAVTKLLSMLLIIAFILNGIFVIMVEVKVFKAVYQTFRFLKENTPNFDLKGTWGLVLGVVMNCWVVIWCCLDSYIVIGASPNAADLIKDALALLFLYNLDDIGGDLGFFDSDDWPGERLSWIYDEIVHPCPDEFFDEKIFDWPGYFAIICYAVTTGVLHIMLIGIPILTACTPFLAILPPD